MNNISYHMLNIHVVLKMYNSETLENLRVTAVGGIQFIRFFFFYF